MKLIHRALVAGRVHHYHHYDLKRSDLGPKQSTYIHNPALSAQLEPLTVFDSLKHACIILPEQVLTGTVFNQNITK